MDLEDFKSFCRVLKPSGVGSIPTHSRQNLTVYQADRGFVSTMTVPGIRHTRADRISNARLISLFVIAVAWTALSPFDACLALETGAPPHGGAATVRDAASDTTRIEGAGITWTKDELKDVLTEQSGIGPDGAAVKGKNARVAMLCTLLFPGLGQMYNERPFKAIIAMGVETFYMSQILFNHRNSQRAERYRDRLPYGSSEWNRQNWWVDEYKERRLDWIWWSSGILFVLMIDSYIDSHLYDMHVKIEGVSHEGGSGIQFVYSF